MHEAEEKVIAMLKKEKMDRAEEGSPSEEFVNHMRYWSMLGRLIG